MRIEQHLMTLRGIRLNNKRPAEAQLQMRQHDLTPHPADDDVLFTPVKLMRFTRLKLQRHKGFDGSRSATFPPAADELGDPAIVLNCTQI